jgi:1-acyl-sn-glycerol-3-phosphate acyltransferase
VVCQIGLQKREKGQILAPSSVKQVPYIMTVPRDIRVNLVAHWTGRLLLPLFGWKTEGQLPDTPKWVCIVAWHTSNWDFFFGLLTSWVFRMHTNFLGKAPLFRGPFGWFFRAVGGIPVDRTRHQNLVGAAVDALKTRQHLIFVLTPEGTRRKTEYWKSGFYHIALEAHVPIVLAFLDYGRKVGGLGPAIFPTGDIEADLEKIRTFYSTVTPKHSELRGEIRFKKADSGNKAPPSE